MIGPLLERLNAIAGKPARTVVGMISGTSADAIDIAVCRIEGSGIPRPGTPGARATLLHFEEYPHEPALRSRIIDNSCQTARDVAELNVNVGVAFAEACLSALRSAAIDPAEVDLIGSHGQTLYHYSMVPGAPRVTLQVGDADQIAERTGLPVISDFRNRDIAAGGEGAPITPFADRILFAGDAVAGEESGRRLVVNLGGIANITVLYDDPARIHGFDTGPANTLMDRLARILSDGALPCDRDGRLASQGQVDERLLARLLDGDPFLKKVPPKSTGPEMYGQAYLSEAASAHGGYDAGLMATLTEFTARSIARAMADFVADGPPVVEVILAGGGVKNPELRRRIAANLAPVQVRSSDERGVPADAREAMAFAVLANEALLGNPTAWPGITGVARPVILGRLAFPGT